MIPNPLAAPSLGYVEEANTIPRKLQLLDGMSAHD